MSKRFGNAQILRDVSLTVPSGSICALLGPSGSGKTTLLRVVAGLEQAEAGVGTLDSRVLFDGTNGAWIAPEHRQIGMVFQDWAIFPHLSVGKNVAFGLGRRDPGQRVGEVLEMVGLAGFGDRMPATLSGGQLQRVALARALAPRPQALLLDEPFSNLDVALRARVRADLHRLLSDADVTTVFVTHDQEEAFVLGDQVAVMRDGEILQSSSPFDLYSSPGDPWIAAFVGDVNLVPGTADGSEVGTAIGRLPTRSTGHGPVQVLVRPEDVSIAPGDDCIVTSVEFYGHDTMIECLHPAGAVLRLRVRACQVRKGDRIGVQHSGAPVVTFPAASAESESDAEPDAGRARPSRVPRESTADRQAGRALG